MTRRGFTLLEVLVAGGVLFIVSSAVVGLSNSIIQGTGYNADRTEANRWASEGLELTNKVRGDSLKQAGTTVGSGERIWFAPAAEVTTYGWYELTPPSGQATKWTLDPLPGYSATVHLPYDRVVASAANVLHGQGITAYRLICVEAYGAADFIPNDQKADGKHVDCNRAPDPTQIVRASDGSRSSVTNCQPSDTYCQATTDSLNRNSTVSRKIIPPGNVVKVRSIIIWQDRSEFRQVEVGTVMTNWKGYEQD